MRISSPGQPTSTSTREDRTCSETYRDAAISVIADGTVAAGHLVTADRQLKFRSFSVFHQQKVSQLFCCLHRLKLTRHRDECTHAHTHTHTHTLSAQRSQVEVHTTHTHAHTHTHIHQKYARHRLASFHTHTHTRTHAHARTHTCRTVLTLHTLLTTTSPAPELSVVVTHASCGLVALHVFGSTVLLHVFPTPL